MGSECRNVASCGKCGAPAREPFGGRLTRAVARLCNPQYSSPGQRQFATARARGETAGASETRRQFCARETDVMAGAFDRQPWTPADNTLMRDWLDLPKERHAEEFQRHELLRMCNIAIRFCRKAYTRTNGETVALAIDIFDARPWTIPLWVPAAGSLEGSFDWTKTMVFDWRHLLALLDDGQLSWAGRLRENVVGVRISPAPSTNVRGEAVLSGRSWQMVFLVGNGDTGYACRPSDGGAWPRVGDKLQIVAGLLPRVPRRRTRIAEGEKSARCGCGGWDERVFRRHMAERRIPTGGYDVAVQVTFRAGVEPPSPGVAFAAPPGLPPPPRAPPIRRRIPERGDRESEANENRSVDLALASDANEEATLQAAQPLPDGFALVANAGGEEVADARVHFPGPRWWWQNDEGWRRWKMY